MLAVRHTHRARPRSRALGGCLVHRPEQVPRAVLADRLPALRVGLLVGRATGPSRTDRRQARRQPAALLALLRRGHVRLRQQGVQTAAPRVAARAEARSVVLRHRGQWPEAHAAVDPAESLGRHTRPGALRGADDCAGGLDIVRRDGRAADARGDERGDHHRPLPCVELPAQRRIGARVRGAPWRGARRRLVHSLPVARAARRGAARGDARRTEGAA